MEALLAFLLEQALKGAGSAAFKAVGKFVLQQTPRVITGAFIRELMRKPLTPSENLFITRAQEQVAESVFPRRSAIRDSFEAINQRLIVLGGSNESHALDNFIRDKVDLSSLELEDQGKWAGAEVESKIGRLMISCESSSPSSIMLIAAVSQVCPVAEIHLQGLMPDEQFAGAQDKHPEVGIFAIAHYLISSHADVRQNYVFYAPLYPTYNHLFVRDSKRNKFRRVHIIAETSGLEQVRMSGQIDTNIEFAELDARSSSEIQREVGEGDGVILWPPLTKDLLSHGFREVKTGLYETWVGIYLRRDIMAETPAARTQRHAIIRLLAWGWLKLDRVPIGEIFLEHPDLRKKLPLYWPV